jgi:uncharacterized Zn ribbon protein
MLNGNRQEEIRKILNTDSILNQGKNEETVPKIMKDIEGNELKEGDQVYFPGGRELMKGVVVKIKHLKFRSQAYIENESGYKKWKDSSSLIKRN